MKIKDGYILKDVAGAKIVIATGAQKINFNGVMTFNSVGAEIFNMLDGTNSVEEIVKKIASDYNAPIETVKTDVEKLINKMREHNLLDE
ncbi:MAG: PqqD family protein [Clostridia bacterium]|nr:PqqD family protein [Clostridia bacterium]